MNKSIYCLVCYQLKYVDYIEDDERTLRKGIHPIIFLNKRISPTEIYPLLQKVYCSSCGIFYHNDSI